MDEEMTITYDARSDVLYLAFGAPREAVSEEFEEGVLVRRDPFSDEVVGFTIIDFQGRGQKSLSVITLPPKSTARAVPNRR